LEAGQAQTLRQSVIRGIAWKVASQLFGQFFQLLVALILARLLVPRDYGLAAMVLVFAALVPIFADLALGAALVQRRELSEDDRSTVFWTGTAVGAAFTLLGVGLAGFVADFYDEPAVRGLFAALSLSFVVTALGTTQRALLTREMDFKKLELISMGANAVGGAVGIAAAFLGYGAWAIVGQQIVIAFVSTLLVWFGSVWRPHLVFSRASLRSMLGFSGNVFLTRILFYVNRNADNVLIGRYLGPTALGPYALAYNVMLAPISRLTWPIVEVFFPAFSQLQHDPERIAAAWVRVNRIIGAITVPAMLGLVVVAPEFVSVVLGDRWEDAVPVIRLLAWVGLLQSLQGLNSSILQARNRTNLLLRYSIVVVIASLTAFAVGVQWGIVGVAAAYAISSTLVEPYYAWLTARVIGTTLRRLVAGLAPVVQAALAMIVVVVLARRALISQGASDAPLLVSLVVLGIAVYVPLVAWRSPDLVTEVRQLRRRGRPADDAG
jgi:O-antigen/teichoic acid export membrane protein